jgi:hypothetical protein
MCVKTYLASLSNFTSGKHQNLNGYGLIKKKFLD